jgi:quinol-cytochrome oxidoreductase complex cytochrome b subunit
MRITHEVYYGWWLRYAHANGASFFFLSVYFHMARGIYYSSYLYPRQKVWFSGSFIWLLMIITAFLGYMLPWGQMSFWGAMVITSLLSAIPLLGGDLLFLIWGGFSIGDHTLKRFFGLHFFLPFLILLISMMHMAFIHESGSSNPATITIVHDGNPFLPYYVIKDYHSLLICFILFTICVCFYPDIFGHADNYVEADPMVTPAHIVPEWYFLPLYAILRSVPNKLFGLFLIIMFFACIFLLPFICKNFIIRIGTFRPFYATSVWLFFSVCFSLGWIGGLPVVTPFYEIGQVLTFLYYFLLIIVFPFCGFVEKVIYIWYIAKHSARIKQLISAGLDPFYNLNYIVALEIFSFCAKFFGGPKIYTFLQAHMKSASKYAKMLEEKSITFLCFLCVYCYKTSLELTRLSAYDKSRSHYDRAFTFLNDVREAKNGLVYSFKSNLYVFFFNYDKSLLVYYFKSAVYLFFFNHLNIDRS